MNAITKTQPRASDLPPNERYTGYATRSPEHASKFDPFEPDALGALREAYAFISQPLASVISDVNGRKVHRATYDMSGYNELTAMLRLAIRRAA